MIRYIKPLIICSTVMFPVSPLGPTINIQTSWRGFPSMITAAVSVPSNREPEGYKYYVFSRCKSLIHTCTIVIFTLNRVREWIQFKIILVQRCQKALFCAHQDTNFQSRVVRSSYQLEVRRKNLIQIPIDPHLKKKKAMELTQFVEVKKISPSKLLFILTKLPSLADVLPSFTSCLKCLTRTMCVWVCAPGWGGGLDRCKGH